MSSEITVKSSNIFPLKSAATREQREKLLGQRGCVVWFTGLSGSGKSTLACALERELIERGALAFLLDGDNVRHGLSRDLGFEKADREENIRRIGEVAALFAECGVITLTAFISPYRKDRLRAKETVGEERFLEVHVHAPLETCEKRDPKGLYQRARAGEIQNFTGLDAPYETPENPMLRIDTHENKVAKSVSSIIRLLKERGFLHQ